MPKSQVAQNQPKKKSFFRSALGFVGNVILGAALVLTVLVFPLSIVPIGVLLWNSNSSDNRESNKSNQANQAKQLNQKSGKNIEKTIDNNQSFDENAEYIDPSEQSPSKSPSLNGSSHAKPITKQEFKKEPEKKSWVSRFFGSSKTNLKER